MASIRLVSDQYLIALDPLKILVSGIWPAGPDNEVRGQNFSDRFCGLMCWMGMPKEKFVPPTGGLLVGFMLAPPALGWNFFFEKNFDLRFGYLTPNGFGYNFVCSDKISGSYVLPKEIWLGGAV
jgi:hypothetical protein